MNENLQPRTENGASLFVIALWLAVLSGLLEAAVLSVFWVMPEWLTWRIRLENASVEIFWIAPAFDILLYSALTLPLLAVLKAKERLTARLQFLNRLHLARLALLLFTWMGLYAALMVPDRLSRKAAFLLALGVAYQAVRLLGPRLDRLIPWLRPRAPFAVALVVLMALLTNGGIALQEQLAVARLPKVDPRLPNVLLIVADTLRADHLSCYGYRRPTSPTIDKIAREGALFENSIASSSWSPPSHASLLLGRRVSEHKVDGYLPAVDAKYRTLAEQLSSSGYVTGGFSANLLWITSRAGFARGFSHYEDYFTNPPDMVNRTAFGKQIVKWVVRAVGYRDMVGRKSARDINRRLLGWIDRRKESRPFFAFVNYFDLHTPYISPEPFHTRFMTPEQRVEARDYHFNFEVSQGPPPKKELAKAAYDGGIAYLDAELGNLMTELKARELLDNTIVVITSDHGESFGERRQFGHGHSLGLELIRVPLIIRYPDKVPAGSRVAAPVGFRTLPATIMDLTVGRPVPFVFPTVSLRSYWSQPQDQNSKPGYIVSQLQAQPWLPASLPVSQGNLTSVILPSWQIVLQNQRAEIYALRPGPQNDLANTDEGRKVLKDELPAIQTWIRKNLNN